MMTPQQALEDLTSLALRSESGGVYELTDVIERALPSTPSAADTLDAPVTSVELVAAARWLLLLRDDPALSGTIYRGALGMWSEMTSAPSEATAVEWAEQVAALDTLTAHVTPF